MIKKIQYQNEEDRLSILNAHLKWHLREEQNLKEGNFLIFTDDKPLEEVVKELQRDNLTTFDVLATIYEELMTKGSV